MVSIIHKRSFTKAVGAIHRLISFCKLKLSLRWKDGAATQMDRSNTTSEISFHGLPSKSKCPSIKKQIGWSASETEVWKF